MTFFDKGSGPSAKAPIYKGAAPRYPILGSFSNIASARAALRSRAAPFYAPGANQALSIAANVIY